MPRRSPSASLMACPKRDPGVLDGVVTVDVQVALGVHHDVEEAVPRDGVEHVIEEADPGLDRGLAGAVTRSARGSRFRP
jgi:hypothetical protein